MPAEGIGISPQRLVCEALLALPESDRELYRWVTEGSPGTVRGGPPYVTIWSRGIDKGTIAVILQIERGGDPDEQDEGTEGFQISFL